MTREEEIEKEIDARFDRWRRIESEGRAAVMNDIEETRRPFTGKLKPLRQNPYSAHTPEGESWYQGYDEALSEWFRS